jgi:very-short-patch-repair endonuclease
MAAVLACGPEAVLSHRAAGALWEILSPPSLIDVTVPGNGGRKRRDGLRIHRSATLLPSHTTLRRAIPVTKPARTLEDLRRVLPREEFAQALGEAQFLRLPIGDHFEPDRTRTELEGRFLALCRRHRLPRPEVNVRVGPDTVDFLWRHSRVVVEVDGWEGHRMRSAFEEDRARDARLTLRGYTVVRFTWRRLEDDRAAVAATVRELLL